MGEGSENNNNQGISLKLSENEKLTLALQAAVVTLITLNNP